MGPTARTTAETTTEQPARWSSRQTSWDRQQEAYLPDREQRFAALLDVVEATRGEQPRVLDLACGTASITGRLLARLPGATSVAVDLDPALLRIAAGTHAGDERVRIVRADLGTPDWVRAVTDAAPEVAHGGFDAVLTATALHWLTPERQRALYAEVAGLLAPGGVFCNADHMPDPGLPALTGRLGQWRDARRESLYAEGTALSWSQWWDAARSAPELADAVAERDAIFAASHGSSESMPPYTTHLDYLRAAGFAEVGLVWRGLTDAAFAAVR
ncbi:Methyltransferase domain-containing protein [Actinopolymorpha cephalotaxi]|uniref:Methyltransferase domain-containing protein n=1 Tax=Actinopolymorpha cephalotaxi TaxID=504797 RepID=A0A1I3B4U3_9ACTN|nr:class I SAM-dependent methyltransferase [Actinopolymorpha cephalotaxi]NYH81250.1 SAM-dependent methyltransferase [Actinopolymorpha cephalotaxi]SFH57328.1 Methyltransferase domain-containing protein [Actinopolymorpha cephalotaxi]